MNKLGKMLDNDILLWLIIMSLIVLIIVIYVRVDNLTKKDDEWQSEDGKSKVTGNYNPYAPNHPCYRGHPYWKVVGTYNKVMDPCTCGGTCLNCPGCCDKYAPYEPCVKVDEQRLPCLC